MHPGDVTFYVDAAGVRHPAVVSSICSDGSVNLAVLKVNQSRIPVSADPIPGHAWDPTLPASNRGDVIDQPAESGVIDQPAQNLDGLAAGDEGDNQQPLSAAEAQEIGANPQFEQSVTQEAPGPDHADPASEGGQ